MARARLQNGTEKDSHEGLRIESSKQRETGEIKNDPEKNLWGWLKNDGTDMGNSGERSKSKKWVAALSLTDRHNERRRRIQRVNNFLKSNKLIFKSFFLHAPSNAIYLSMNCNIYLPNYLYIYTYSINLSAKTFNNVIIY